MLYNLLGHSCIHQLTIIAGPLIICWDTFIYYNSLQKLVMIVDKTREILQFSTIPMKIHCKSPLLMVNDG